MSLQAARTRAHYMQREKAPAGLALGQQLAQQYRLRERAGRSPKSQRHSQARLGLGTTYWLVPDHPSGWQQPLQPGPRPFPEAPPGPAPGRGKRGSRSPPGPRTHARSCQHELPAPRRQPPSVPPFPLSGPAPPFNPRLSSGSPAQQASEITTGNTNKDSVRENVNSTAMRPVRRGPSSAMGEPTSPCPLALGPSPSDSEGRS